MAVNMSLSIRQRRLRNIIRSSFYNCRQESSVLEPTVGIARRTIDFVVERQECRRVFFHDIVITAVALFNGSSNRITGARHGDE